jgi:hypothetical protein
MAFSQSLARGLVLAALVSVAFGLLAEVSKRAPDLTLDRRGGRRDGRLDEAETGTAEWATPQPWSTGTQDSCWS